MPSRAKWTAAVRNAAERLGMDWCYWEFAAGFGVYEPQRMRYRQPLLEALRP